MAATKSVELTVVPATFDHEADAPTVARALSAMSCEALVAEVHRTAERYAELERSSSSLFKRLAVLFARLKALDQGFKPWVAFRGVLSHGALSNASQAVPVAQSFLNGHISVDVWRQLTFADCLELRHAEVKLNGDLRSLGVAASLRLLEPTFSGPYLAACALTSDPQGWAKKAITHQLSPTDIAASAEAGKIMHHAVQSGRIGCLSIRPIARMFARWAAEQKNVAHWPRSRCEELLAVLAEIATFIERLRERLAKKH